jgi:predicted transcriptional regulator
LDISENRGMLVDVIMSEARREIILSLVNKPKHISDLSRELKKDRSTIAYHLDLLEKAEIITNKYELIKDIASTGKIGNYFYVNPEMLKRAIKYAQEEIENLSQAKSGRGTTG